jgi:hypothetical protein
MSEMKTVRKRIGEWAFRSCISRPPSDSDAHKIAIRRYEWMTRRRRLAYKKGTYAWNIT